MDYEKTLETVKQMVKDGQVSQETAELYFPELDEFEDEKIRKGLIEFFRDWGKTRSYCWNIYIPDILAWLEKQVEQKPVDKVEPKFKVGEWIIRRSGAFKHNTYLVKEVKNYYVCEELKGRQVTFTFSDVYKKFKLWTIENARDGSVLYSPSHHLIWIYKDDEHYHACVNMNYVTGNVATDGLISIPDDACPATRVQRSILFQKMEESNYKWDAEKKELKKIEQEPAETANRSPQEESNPNKKPQRIISAETKEAMYDKLWSEEDNELSCFESALFTAFSYAWQSYLLGEEVNIKQWAKEQSKELLEAAKEELKGNNTAWSEEDDAYLDHIITAVKLYYTDDKSKENPWRNELLDWLKSLKERVQPKQEWSEADEINLEGIIAEIEANKNNASDYDLATYYRFLSWLKSLRPQPQVETE